MTPVPEKGTSCPIKTAVVGLGRAGWDIHVRALRNRPDYQIVAAVDVDEKRRAHAEAELGCKSFADLGSCLAGSPAELVIVANRSVDHAQDTIQALEAGRHVLVEKPMATTLAEADRMIEAARRTGRLLSVHQNRRLDPDLLYVQRVMESGILGRIFEIKIGIYGFARRNDWQTLKALGGGMLNNWGSHMLDQALLLLGAPVERVLGNLQQVACAGDSEDHVKIILVGRNGRLIDLEVTGACAQPLPRWVVMGSCGTMVVHNSESRIRRYDPAQVQPLEVVRESPADRRYGNDDVLPWEEWVEEAAVASQADFHTSLYLAIREGGPLLVKPEEVRETIRIMELCREGTEFALQP
jgi:scyllo-inositol 2-dehydrogenase (NADP+)